MTYADNFSFHDIFTSHMVLQRRKMIVFSGSGEPGKKVKMIFAGLRREAVVGGSGEWQIEFPPQEASGTPLTAVLSGADGIPPVELNDLLIGEVWICSGQSNMNMFLRNVANPFYEAKNAVAEQAAANYPLLRLYNCTATASPDKICTEIEGPGWEVCTPESAGKFSACGYFFGRDLQQELSGIPIGLIDSSWGGTRIEAWMPRRKFEESHFVPHRDDTSSQESWQKVLASGICNELKQWIEHFNDFGEAAPETLALEYDDSSWEACDGTLPRVGRYVVRISFELPEAYAGKAGNVNFGSVNDMDRTWLNGQAIGATGLETCSYWSCLRNYPFPAGLLRPGKNVLAIVADNHCGDGSVNARKLNFTFDGKEVRLPVAVKKYLPVFTCPDLPPRPGVPAGENVGKGNANYPSTLFNSMLAPWRKLPIRGFIWYQGCQNAGEYSYYYLHKLFIEALREEWQDPAMPFLLVQLAAFHQQCPENRLSDDEVEKLPFPERHPWAVTREIQSALVHDLKNVGMITAFDCGDHSDVHPRDKQTPGFRLAKKAMAMVYGAEIIADGPEFSGMEIHDTTVILHFRNCGSGLATTDGKPPLGFWWGYRTGDLMPCKDVAIEGDTVVIRNLVEPQRIRYAFTGYCRVNLCNKEGFPALPFRTDATDYRTMFIE